MNGEPAPIPGVVIRRPVRHTDDRGWLLEVFRDDDLPPGIRPAMAYVSLTRPGVTRGPHEHRRQTDWFCFAGPGRFELWLWDNRPDSPARGRRMVLTGGADAPLVAAVPPGVVHAYRNVSDTDGVVVNCPDALFRGPGRREEVDEIRHEDDPATPFRLEDPS